MGTPRVSFYFNVANRDRALSQLAGKAWKQGLSVAIATESEADSHALDRFLWESPSIGFLPHCLAGDEVAGDTPIWLDHRLDALVPRNVLFNLNARDWAEDELQALSQVDRVIEVVAQDDEAGRQDARRHVARYRQAGFDVEFTDMAKLEQVPQHG